MTFFALDMINCFPVDLAHFVIRMCFVFCGQGDDLITEAFRLDQADSCETKLDDIDEFSEHYSKKGAYLLVPLPHHAVLQNVSALPRLPVLQSCVRPHVAEYEIMVKIFQDDVVIDMIHC